MPALQSRDEIVRVVQSLPNEVSLDDVIDRLILLRKVNIGLVQNGQGVAQSTAEAEFSKPKHERSWNCG